MGESGKGIDNIVIALDGSVSAFQAPNSCQIMPANAVFVFDCVVSG